MPKSLAPRPYLRPHPIKLSLLIVSFICSLTPVFVEGAPRNATIDDHYGDEVFRSAVRYLPQGGGFWEGEECGGCRVKPDVQRVLSGTYMATTYRDIDGTRLPREFSFQFTGSALYVFLTLANFAGENITTLTEVDFVLDDQSRVPFRHEPDMTTAEFLYQHLAFSATGLEHRTHTFKGIMDRPLSYNTYLNFDYAIYTYDDALINTSITGNRPGATSTSISPNPTSSNNKSESNQSLVGPIAGGVVGGLALFGIAIFAFVFLRRRSKRRAAQLNPHAAQKEYPSPEVFAYTGHLNPGTATSYSGGSGAAGAAQRPGYALHRPGQPSITLTTTTGTSTDWSSMYLPGAQGATPYGHQPSGYVPNGSLASLAAGGVVSLGAAGQSIHTMQSTESNPSTSKREMLRRERERERGLMNSAHPNTTEPTGQQLPHASGNSPYPSSGGNPPFDPTSLYGPNTHTRDLSGQPPPPAPHNDVEFGGNGPSALSERIRSLQASIQAVKHSIRAEEEAMRESGRTEQEIRSDGALVAMRQSLRVMKDQLRALRSSSDTQGMGGSESGGGGETLPEYSEEQRQSFARPRSTAKQ